MKQRFNFSMAIVVVLTIYCGPVLAERVPEKPSDANVIVWGTVEEIVRSETDENTNYEVRIRVESVELVWRVVGCSARRRFGPSLLHVVEPPYAEPHVRWCGGRAGKPARLPDYAADRFCHEVTTTFDHA